MSLSDLVNVTIDKQTSAVSRVGFGTPMIMSTEADIDNVFDDTAKLYASLAELGPTGDNFDTTGVTYLMAQTLFGQTPKIKQLVIGKRASPPLMTVDMLPVVKNNSLYSVTINGEVHSFTSTGAATDALIVTAMSALINAGTQNVLASGTIILKVEAADSPGGVATAGKPYTILFNRARFNSLNITPDPGIAADLLTIQSSVDGNDDWYSLHVDSFGKPEIEALAPTIEAQNKIYLPTTFDFNILTSLTTDIGSTLQASNYARTALAWHDTPGFSDVGAAWAGRVLPTDPGFVTWMFKGLVGPAFSTLSGAENGFLTTKGVNSYIRKAGNNYMQHGVTASGEFLDITRGIDFIVARIQEGVFDRMINLPKIPFTDPGIAVITTEVQGVMQLGVSQSIFTSVPAPTTTAPLAADVSLTDKANRLLPDVVATGVLAGAIHATEVKLTVTL